MVKAEKAFYKEDNALQNIRIIFHHQATKKEMVKDRMSYLKHFRKMIIEQQNLGPVK
eukprot:UN00735